MHPTMDQILGSLVVGCSLGGNPMSVSRPEASIVAEGVSSECESSLSHEVKEEEDENKNKDEEEEEDLEEDLEEDALMKALVGEAEPYGSILPPKEEQVPLSTKETLEESSEKHLQRLKSRQVHLQERFSSLSRRLVALRTFKFGSHVADHLRFLEETKKKQTQTQTQKHPHHLPLVQAHEGHEGISRLEGQLKFILSSGEGLDSEATESSSGGESCDELEAFPSINNQSRPIQKRAKWNWLKNRAALAAKWNWLTAQISDLEFKIRQNTELYRQLRASKPPILLERPSLHQVQNMMMASQCETRTLQSLGRQIVIKEARLPQERAEEEAMGASRTRPLKSFVRRRVLSHHHLHKSSPQAAKELSVRCHCLLPDRWCALCFGKKNASTRFPGRELRGSTQSIALLDHAYHHVISSKTQDVSLDLHMMTKIKNRAWLTAKESSASSQCVPASNTTPLSVKHLGGAEKKSLKKKKNGNEEENPSSPSEMNNSSSSTPLSSSYKSKKKKKKKGTEKSRRRSLSTLGGYDASSSLQDYCTDDMDDLDSSPLPSPSLSGDLNNRTWLEHVKRRRESAYDIDNIVIPYSIAASTRVERIKYKEIITPTWRVLKDDLKKESNNEEPLQGEEEEEEEDICQSTYEIRHRKAELEEQRRWKTLPFKQTGGQRVRSRRQDSKTELGSGCNTPDPLSPAMVVDALEVSTRPSTPLSATDESSSTPQSIRERRRTTSSTKLRLEEASAAAFSGASPLPYSTHILLESGLPDSLPDKSPFEVRTFPISEKEYEKMAAADTLSQSTQPSESASASKVEEEEDNRDADDEEVRDLMEDKQQRKKPSSQQQQQSIPSNDKTLLPPNISGIVSSSKASNNNGRINNNIIMKNSSSCEASSDEDRDYVMDDDLDWNGDDPNDPEWAAESQSKSEN